jgi:hypothetical protein
MMDTSKHEMTNFTSARRYYLNNYEDGHKQDALDLLTGTFQPRKARRLLPDVARA